MSILQAVIAVMRELREADAHHQKRVDGLLDRYFAFLRSREFDTRRAINGRGLRMRRCRDKSGRVRKIAWTRRIFPRNGITWGKAKGLTAILPEPYTNDHVFRYAKDWNRRDAYRAFDRERCWWNRTASSIADSRRRLRLALENKWEPKATHEDWGDVHGFGGSAIEPRDYRPLAGAAALSQALIHLEGEMQTVIEAYWRTFDSSLTVSFEPHLSRRPNGYARLQWGVRSGGHGGRTYLKYMRPPTDRAMRQLHVPRKVRSGVGAFVKQLRMLERDYRSHVTWILKLLAGARRAARAVYEPLRPGGDRERR